MAPLKLYIYDIWNSSTAFFECCVVFATSVYLCIFRYNWLHLTNHNLLRPYGFAQSWRPLRACVFTAELFCTHRFIFFIFLLLHFSVRFFWCFHSWTILHTQVHIFHVSFVTFFCPFLLVFSQLNYSAHTGSYFSCFFCYIFLSVSFGVFTAKIFCTHRNAEDSTCFHQIKSNLCNASF